MRRDRRRLASPRTALTPASLLPLTSLFRTRHHRDPGPQREATRIAESDALWGNAFGDDVAVRGELNRAMMAR